MSAARIAWSWAARTFAEIGEGWAKTGCKTPTVSELPRIMAATLLFLRASHEAFSKETGKSLDQIGHEEMMAFVYFAKNSIIHHGERLPMVTGPAPPGVKTGPGLPLAFTIKGFELEFEGPDAKLAMRDDKMRAMAKAYATRHDSRGVVGGLLAEIRDAIVDTGQLIGVQDAELERFRNTPSPVFL